LAFLIKIKTTITIRDHVLRAPLRRRAEGRQALLTNKHAHIDRSSQSAHPLRTTEAADEFAASG
jgi:hypothetical protein